MRITVPLFAALVLGDPAHRFPLYASLSIKSLFLAIQPLAVGHWKRASESIFSIADVLPGTGLHVLAR
jgi:hypothetical protein